MHVDPDLQLECPQCGCEVLFDVDVDGVLVESDDGLSVRFATHEGRTQVLRSVPMLDPTLDIDCPHCSFSGFLSDVMDELGPANTLRPGTTVRRRPVDPDAQPICPRCGCEGMFEIMVPGVLIQTANGPVVRYPRQPHGEVEYSSTPPLHAEHEIDCPHCGHRSVIGEIYDEHEVKQA